MKARMYTKPSCQFCVNAKTLMDIKGIEFVTLEVGKDLTREEFFEAVPTAQTFPQIFLTEDGQEEKLIGGYTDLVAYLKGR